MRPGYTGAYAARDGGASLALARVLAVGMDAELLLKACGSPDSLAHSGALWVYRSCGGGVRAEVRAGRVVWLLY